MDIQLKKKGEQIKKQFWNIWNKIGPKVLEKFKNINGKTSKCDVPDALYQNRTSRTNRVLLRWKIIKKNKLNYQQLSTFYGGLCVELVNDDFFNKDNYKNPLFNKLIKRIGSDEKISAILSFRNEDGDSGANVARKSFEKFKKMEDRENYFKIQRDDSVRCSGRGDNNVWKGNLFYSIKGGSQDRIESHPNDMRLALFNPALEYANEIVCLDIDITMSYLAMHCFDFNKNLIKNFNDFKNLVELYLSKRNYDEGNLLAYCQNHYSIKFWEGILVDPIQLIPISIRDFETSRGENSSVVCHNQSVNKNIFRFDNKQKFILSPARPTNFFWSKHLSNMMQQNYTLEEYFSKEEERFLKRKNIIDKIDKNTLKL